MNWKYFTADIYVYLDVPRYILKEFDKLCVLWPIFRYREKNVESGLCVPPFHVCCLYVMGRFLSRSILIGQKQAHYNPYNKVIGS